VSIANRGHPNRTGAIQLEAPPLPFGNTTPYKNNLEEFPSAAPKGGFLRFRANLPPNEQSSGLGAAQVRVDTLEEKGSFSPNPQVSGVRQLCK
jgi:hypothetical protein